MRLLPSFRVWVLLLLSTALLTGCSWFGGGTKDDEEATETAGYTEEDFYQVIQSNLDARRWDLAIQNLQALEAQFPFGDYADQAQLELVYARYRSGDYEAAIAAADRFVRLHPRHPNVDYAHYLKGLSQARQSRGFLTGFMPIDQTQRDPATAREAFATFNELLARYPDSEYAPDARKRMIALRNLLAREEINVANYYFRRGAWLAAANRGRYVVENYQRTPAVPDGLAVMAQAYHLLGYDDLSNDAVEVLATNYPEYPFLNANGEFQYQEDMTGENRTFLNRVTFGLYDNRPPQGFDTRHIYEADPAEALEDEDDAPRRSWWSRMTFGLFSDE